MAQDREPAIQRIVNFLYDALDRFRDTMSELNQNVSVLMDSLKKAEGDLSGTGYQRVGGSTSAALSTMQTRGPQSSSNSRTKLIALLSGQSVAPPSPVTGSARPAAGPPAAGPPRPAAGPPRPAAGPPRPPGASPAAGPPRPAAGPPAAGPPAAGPPRPAAGPPAAGPPAAGPPRPAAGPPAAGPPAAGPPRPAAPPAPAATSVVAGPPRPAATAGPAAGSGAPTISGLRDEMLKELKRLKSIMKGEK